MSGWNDCLFCLRSKYQQAFIIEWRAVEFAAICLAGLLPPIRFRVTFDDSFADFYNACYIGHLLSLAAHLMDASFAKIIVNDRQRGRYEAEEIQVNTFKRLDMKNVHHMEDIFSFVCEQFNARSLDI